MYGTLAVLYGMMFLQQVLYVALSSYKCVCRCEAVSVDIFSLHYCCTVPLYSSFFIGQLEVLLNFFKLAVVDG